MQLNGVSANSLILNLTAVVETVVLDLSHPDALGCANKPINVRQPRHCLLKTLLQVHVSAGIKPSSGCTRLCKEKMPTTM